MNSKALLMWLGAGIGTLLLYAAYKGKSPTSLLSAAVGSGKAAGTTTKEAAPAAPGAVGAVGTAVADSTGTVVIDGTTYTTDSYGNPIAPIASAYSTSPATYIPPSTQVA